MVQAALKPSNPNTPSHTSTPRTLKEKHEQELLDAILALKTQGASLTEIAVELGYSRSTIIRKMKVIKG